MVGSNMGEGELLFLPTVTEVMIDKLGVIVAVNAQEREWELSLVSFH